jgi:cytochrome c553
VFLNRLLLAFLSLWMATLAAPAIAQSASAQATAGVDLSIRLKEAERDPKLAEALRKRGQKVAAVCDNCHGVSGNSQQLDVPNLADQNQVYLLEQLRQFAVGERRKKFMEGIIRSMTSDEKVGMSLFYASQKVKHKPVANTVLPIQGEAYYIRNCQGCHGEYGHGKEKIARLAGQQPVYLHTALNRYRTGTGLRLDLAMAKVIQRMSDGDIDAVVDYLMSMQ